MKACARGGSVVIVPVVCTGFNCAEAGLTDEHNRRHNFEEENIVPGELYLELQLLLWNIQHSASFLCAAVSLCYN